MLAKAALNLNDEVGALDDLCDLGLTGPIAARLAAQAHSKLGRKIPSAEIIALRTLEVIADRYRSQPPDAKWSSLVSVRSGGDGLPLVFIHPLGGNAFWYLPLARRLADRHPIYALHSRSLDLTEPLPADIPTLAAAYVDELTEHGLARSCALAGWSFGGAVAFEMAVQLSELGNPVPLLAMFDTGPSDVSAAPPTAEAALYLLIHAFRLDDHAEDIAARNSEEQTSAILHAAVSRHTAPSGFSVDDADRMLDINVAHLSAQHAYRFRPYRGDILVFRSNDRDALPGQPAGTADLGWNTVIDGSISVQPLPGNHFDALSRTNLPMIADRLDQELGSLSVPPVSS